MYRKFIYSEVIYSVKLYKATELAAFFRFLIKINIAIIKTLQQYLTAFARNVYCNFIALSLLFGKLKIL